MDDYTERVFFFSKLQLEYEARIDLKTLFFGTPVCRGIKFGYQFCNLSRNVESLVADLPKDGLEQSSIWNCSCLLVAVRGNACIFFLFGIWRNASNLKIIKTN